METSKTLELYDDLMQVTAAIGAAEAKLVYVKKHGHLPQMKKPAAIASDLSHAEVLIEIRKLTDLISKTKRKLKPSAKPSSPSKIAEWEEKLAMAEIERNKMYILKENFENVS